MLYFSNSYADAKGDFEIHDMDVEKELDLIIYVVIEVTTRGVIMGTLFL